jgi:hypothetical protein
LFRTSKFVLRIFFYEASALESRANQTGRAWSEIKGHTFLVPRHVFPL